ncbi:conserved hypothetical protein [Caldicellulosiruptor hydrothermalis 108]|uniref:Uncharacterized protein n=1 Tax=Caldicellulosiruptor hydrothermalis (strain DSM 18901 / VKM B-2411 / 108) TaxID=632292 RepID=E4QAB8_CALH1|nr:hypothetical protein [Caldicellulosiruptor hydrothermalis]ADQ08222.1 conserved hypothetical protein [Caldicellulosiruptor hydrothermalis 108]
MKREKANTKRVWVVVLIVAVCALGILAGYYMTGYLAKKPAAVDQTLQTDQPSQQLQEETGQTNPNQTQQGQSVSSQPSSQNQQNTTTLSDVYKAFARFDGGVDAHTIQLSLINTNFDYKEFETNENLTQGLNLSEGEIVEVEFEKPQDGGSPRIVSIEKPDKVTLKGKFVGLADNNFAEFVFDQKHVVLQISEVLDKVSYLDENTDVEVTFKTNPQSPQSNPVVEDIKVLK